MEKEEEEEEEEEEEKEEGALAGERKQKNDKSKREKMKEMTGGKFRCGGRLRLQFSPPIFATPIPTLVTPLPLIDRLGWRRLASTL